MLKKILILFYLLSFVLFACAKKIAPQNDPIVFSISDASLPNLSKDENGDILLSYVVQNDEQSSLWMSMLENNQWTSPELVAEGNNWFVNWADFPSVIKVDNKYVAHWLEKNGHGTYAYGVRYSVRDELGKWQAEQWLHLDTSPTEHGFVSLEAEHNQAHAIWLDGRHMHSDQHSSHSNHPKLESLEDISGMTLRYALIDSQGVVKQRQEVDSLTCDCCQTTSVLTDQGLVIAYRDRVVKSLSSEIRDIKVLRQVGGLNTDVWLPSTNTPVDNWDIQACPVNGPVLSANNNQVVLAWFTGVDEKSKVQVAFSDDSAQSFQSAITIDENDNLGRVAVDWLNSETIFISWIGTHSGKSALLYRIVTTNGNMGAVNYVSDIDLSRSSGVPQVAQVTESEILLTWTAVAESPSIQSKIITIN